MLGFPIRTPPDHSSVANSPGIFAGSYVLHRLLMPRHPPCALCSLSQQRQNNTRYKRCSRPLCRSQTTTPPTTTPHPPGQKAVKGRNRTTSPHTLTCAGLILQDPTVCQTTNPTRQPSPFHSPAQDRGCTRHSTTQPGSHSSTIPLVNTTYATDRSPAVMCVCYLERR